MTRFVHAKTTSLASRVHNEVVAADPVAAEEDDDQSAAVGSTILYGTPTPQGPNAPPAGLLHLSWKLYGLVRLATVSVQFSSRYKVKRRDVSLKVKEEDCREEDAVVTLVDVSSRRIMGVVVVVHP